MSEQATLYAFGPFHLDPRGGVLLHNGAALPLTQKQFDTLLYLVQNSGRLIGKDELMDKIWADAVVEPANLTQTVFILRKTLAHYAPGGHFIETAPRRGYRFVASVTEIDPKSSDLTFDSHPSRDGRDHAPRQPSEFNSLAVLPFANASADPNAEYLSDGLTESIINSLSQLRDIRVLARNTVFRYKSSSEDPQKIGGELGVRAVLTGRILQLGDRVIIRAEVMDVQGGWQIWGDQYHRKLADTLEVQEEIAEEISSKLKLKLTADEKRQLSKRHTDNSEAFHLYLKGRYYWNKYAQDGLRKAIEYFKQAIDEDPTYALAYAGLADSYYRLSHIYLPTREAMPRAKRAAEKALEIDETLAEAHAALGLVLMFYDWDWVGAEREFLRAIELNPGSAIAHQRLALYFNLLGRFNESMRELQLAIDLDPLSPQISQGIAVVFFLQGDHQQAIEQMEKTVEIDDGHHPSYYFLGWIYTRTGHLAKALQTFEKLAAMDDSPIFLASLAHVCALTGDRARALGLLDRIEEQSKRRYVSSYCRAVVYTGLGKKDEAFYWLEKAFEERSEMVPWLRIGVEVEGLRSDPRFHDYLRRVGLHRTYDNLISAAS